MGPLGRRQLAALDVAGETLLERGDAYPSSRLIHIDDLHLIGSGQADLGDTKAHGPAANDPDRLDWRPVDRLGPS